MRVRVLDEDFISGTVTARGLRRAGCTVDVIAATGGSGRHVHPAVSDAQRAARRDKRATSACIARAGVRTPLELPASTDGEVATAVVALGLPIVIKGSAGRGGNATHICVSCLVGGLFDAGRALRLYAGAKTLQLPARRRSRLVAAIPLIRRAP